MNIIDAFWEKRNLGVETVEFIVDANDDETVLYDILKNQKQYNVVKLPVNKPGITALLQEDGYRFAECMLCLEHNLSEDVIVKVKLGVNAQVCSLPMADSDLAVLMTELDKNPFDTDRIYNDPFFSPELSAARYKNWVMDEHAGGSGVFKLVYQDTVIGFFVLKKKDNNIFDQLICGLYSDFKGKGFGKSLTFGAVAESIKLGAKAVFTYVSSNNPGSLKVHKAAGYEIADVKYVFIKHIT